MSTKFWHRLKKYLYKKRSFILEKIKKKTRFLNCYTVSFIRSARSPLKIPARVVEPVGPCERQTRSTWRPCSDSADVCSCFRYSLTRCSVWRLQVARPAIHVNPNISGTYVHNLQRTTPTAFCRLWRAPCALCLSVVIRHGAHHYPQDGQQPQFYLPSARGW